MPPATAQPRSWGLPLRLALLAVLFTVLYSWPLWQALLALRETDAARITAMAGLALGINLLLFALLPLGRWPGWVTTIVLLIGAGALHFMMRYGVVLDPAMLENALQTDGPEVAELITRRMLLDILLFGAIPALILSRLPWGPRPSLTRALRLRLAVFGTGLGLALVAVGLHMQDLAPLMRNHKELRYMFSPGNLLASATSALRGSQVIDGGPRALIDPAVRGRDRAAGERRRIIVMVLGETVRASNWGLAGYQRQTTPALAARQDLLATVADSCGTDTATSVPCLFSDIGRQHYDRERIARRENLLQLAKRAGVTVQWREAQAGCKGACDGIDTVWLRHDPEAADAAHCGEHGCFDMALLDGLEQVFDGADGDVLVVLHQMGNHGPGYWRRVPEDQWVFRPVCAVDDLSRCDTTEIVNAYDNAVRYTDSLLARLIERLEQRAARDDLAMLYVSDHGESLGESGLFLHGLPRWMAPEEQTRVPMVLWLSPDWRARAGLDETCRRQLAGAGADHDQVFHTLVGMLGLHTSAYRAEDDLLARCATRAKLR
ncbi:MAG: sulfatase-like hydrolase/transferase [Burkholderiaceae bacterium]